MRYTSDDGSRSGNVSQPVKVRGSLSPVVLSYLAFANCRLQTFWDRDCIIPKYQSYTL